MKIENIEHVKQAFSVGGYRVDFNSRPPIIYQKRNKDTPLFVQINTRGYPQTKLMVNKKAKILPLHQIIAVLGGLDVMGEGEVNHIDGDKLNYCIENLEIVTKCENIRHSVAHGLRVIKLTPEDVRTIRAKFGGGISPKDIAAEYAVDNRTVVNALRGDTFKALAGVDLGATFKVPPLIPKLTKDEVAKIRLLYASGTSSYSKLGVQFGVCATAIGDIIRGKTWREVV